MAESRHSAFRQFAASDWDGFLKGVEKEGLRVDRNGFIAQTPHPEALGSALTHPRADHACVQQHWGDAEVAA